MKKFISIITILALCAGSLRADEGMWLLPLLKKMNGKALKEALCGEIHKRRDTYFTKEEFETAKRVVYANNLFNFDSTDDIANTYMNFWQSDSDYLDYSAILSEIGYEEAWEILRRTVRTDRCAMSVVYPKERT